MLRKFKLKQVGLLGLLGLTLLAEPTLSSTNTIETIRSLFIYEKNNSTNQNNTIYYDGLDYSELLARTIRGEKEAQTMLNKYILLFNNAKYDLQAQRWKFSSNYEPTEKFLEEVAGFVNNLNEYRKLKTTKPINLREIQETSKILKN